MKTIEQKAKAYDEALEKARQLCGYPTTKPFISDLQDLFPELKESEDELEWLTQFIQEEAYSLSMDIRDDEDRSKLKKLQRSLVWIEKQSKQKSTDTCNSSTIDGKEFPASEKRNFRYFIKPKFHEGDWVVDNKSGITQQVLDFRSGIYTCTYNSFTIDCESNYHLWTIKDAKDGDVLQLGTVTAIFKKYIGQEKCMCYCSIDEDGVFEIPVEDGENNIYGCTNTTPATKEQRDLLFAKMEEAGYEYNLNKKELKNVDKKHIIEMKSPEESLGISSKEYNEIVNDCLYSESTPANNVKPKFHEGDWIVQENIGVYKVIEVCESWYEVVDNKNKHYSISFNKEYMCHLWTIQDAKDGDVLTCGDDKRPFIFKGLLDPNHPNCPVAYCGIDSDGLFFVSTGDNWWTDENVCPATNAQRDILFQKMKEAGYTFDFEKKEVKKIHVIDEGKAEMDYCFTKMMNGEKVSPAWSEKDKEIIKRIASFMWQNRKGDTDEIFQQEQDVKWLNSLIHENS